VSFYFMLEPGNSGFNSAGAAASSNSFWRSLWHPTSQTIWAVDFDDKESEKKKERERERKRDREREKSKTEVNQVPRAPAAENAAKRQDSITRLDIYEFSGIYQSSNTTWI
jgi:hypothetical protein